MQFEAWATLDCRLATPIALFFPKANACKPGDPFAETCADDAQACLDDRPFSFHEPAWARFAGRNKGGVSLLKPDDLS